MPRPRSWPVALVAAGALVLAGCGGGRESGDAGTEGAVTNGVLNLDACENYQASPGVSDSEILLGSSFPASGPLATLGQLAQGYRAFFDYANAELGGVGGRQIKVVSYDDGYDPTKTTANVNRLVEQDKVFALMGVPSTAGNFAFWDDTEAKCVPNLMSSTAAAQYDAAMKHRWTLNGLVPYRVEATALADHLKADPKLNSLAVLYQNDDFGKAFLNTFEKTLQGSNIKVTSKQPFQVSDASVTTQVTNLASGKAGSLAIVASGLRCPQALDAVAASGWKPKIVMPYTCTSPSLMKLAKPAGSDGATSLSWYKDPQHTMWKDDQAMKTYRAAVAKYQPKANVDDSFVANGWTWGALVYDILKRSPKLTRADVMETALKLNKVSAGLSLPGLTFNTTKDDPNFVESMQLMRYDGTKKEWTFIKGDTVLPPGQTAIVDYEGRTRSVG
jgi:branched-chain amino acid transport system substrate-binding protein